MRSDTDIKRDVEDERRSDPTIDATDIAVAVKNRVVTLTGFGGAGKTRLVGGLLHHSRGSA